MNKAFFSLNCLLFIILLAALINHEDEQANEAEVRSIQSQVQIAADSIHCSEWGAKRYVLEFPDHMLANGIEEELVDPSLVSVSPKAEYELQWLSSTRLLCEFKNHMKPAQEYRLRLRKGIKSLAGAVLAEDQEFTLGAKRPAIQRCAPSIESATIGAFVQFNMSIDFNNIANLFELKDAEGQTQSFRCEIIDDRSLRLNMKKQFTLPAEYTLTLQPGLSSPLGPLRSLKQQQFDVKIGEPLFAGSSSGQHKQLQINFNQGFSQIDPAYVHVEKQSYTLHRSGSQLRLRGDFTPGALYTVHLLKGFPGHGTVRLQKSQRVSIRVKDRYPSLDFASQGLILSSKALPRMRVRSVNCDKMNLELLSVQQQNYVFLTQNRKRLPHSMYKKVLKCEIPIVGERNKQIETFVDLQKLLKEVPCGLYELRLKIPGRYWHADRRLLHITDIGIHVRAASQEALISCQRISDATVLADARVQVLSKSNVLLAEARTDEEGLAHVTYNKFEQHETAHVVIVEHQNDVAFIDAQQFDTGVLPGSKTGRSYLAKLPAYKQHEAYIHLDRGIIRPGGELHAYIHARDYQSDACAHAKLTLRIYDIDQNIIIERSIQTNDCGLHEFRWSIPNNKKSGLWSLSIMHAEDVIGSKTFLVEDFEPERLHADIQVNAWPKYQDINSASLVTWLEGGAAEQLGANMLVRIDPRDPPKQWAGFQFGPIDANFPGALKAVESKTNTNGKAIFKHSYPSKEFSSQCLQAQFMCEVKSPSGRIVRAIKTVPIEAEQYLGIRCFAEAPGSGEVVLLNKQWQLSTEAQPLLLKVQELNWNFTYERGRWQWKRTYETVYSERIMCVDGKRSFNLQEHCEYRYRYYRISVETEGEQRKMIAACYSHGKQVSSAPNNVFVNADESAQVGEQIQVEIKSDYAGMALLTIEGTRIYEYQRIHLHAGKNTIQLQCPYAHEPNLHIVVTQQCAQAAQQQRAAWFLAGSCSIDIRRSQQLHTISSQIPDRVPSESQISIPIHAPGATYAYVTAVDYGILQITNHPVVNPRDYFQSTRRLAHQGFASCMRLVKGARYSSIPGGGGRLERAPMTNSFLDTSNDADQAIVAIASPLIPLDEHGKATFQLSLPTYEGKLRIHIIAVNSTSVDAQSYDLKVADDVGLHLAAPRQLRPGDEVQLPVNIANRTNADRQFAIEIKVNHVTELKQTIDLAAHKRQTLHMPFKQERPGVYHYSVAIYENNTLLRQQDKTVDVLPVLSFHRNQAPLMFSGYRQIDLSDWQALQSVEVTMNHSIASAQEHCLRDLLTYPHGCLEQTTSRCRGLIALYRQLKGNPTLHSNFDLDRVHDLIQAGIERLQLFRVGSGGLAWWPSQSRTVYDFGSLYAYDCVLDAHELGITVPDSLHNDLRAYAMQHVSSEKDASVSCYALYLLARDKQPVRMYLPLSMQGAQWREDLLHLALVADIYEDDALAAQLLERSVKAEINKAATLHVASSMRCRAKEIYLRNRMNQGLQDETLLHLYSEVLNALNESWRHMHTNERAYTLDALSFINESFSEVIDEDVQLKIYDANDTLVKTINSGERAEMAVHADLDDIRLETTGMCFVTLDVAGQKELKAIQDSPRLKIERSIVDVQSGQTVQHMKHGGCYRIDLICSSSHSLEHLAITDSLPAGCEFVSQRFDHMRGTKQQVKLHKEQRGNKMFIFPQGKLRRFETSYYVQAVFRGNFSCPLLSVESMYNPLQDEQLQYATNMRIE